MSISEEQFEQMTKGTIHEGKYKKPEPVIAQPDEEFDTAGKPRYEIPDRGFRTKPVETDLGDRLKKAEPAIIAIVGIRLLTSPVVLVAVLFVLLILAAKIEAFITGLHKFYTLYPFSSGVIITTGIALGIISVIKK